MPFVRHPVRLDWAPAGLRVELEVPARRGADGALVVSRAREGGVRARRGWLVADGDGSDPDVELLGEHARWILAALTRRWPTIAARLPDPVADAEQLAQLGAIELDCQLTGALGLSGYRGWRLVGWAREESQRRSSANLAIRTDLEAELREPQLIERLREGSVPRGMSWADFVRVLRGAEKWLDMRAHGSELPQERELAVHAAADSKWPWSPARRALLAELVGCPQEQLFAAKTRVVLAQGNIDGLQTNLFDLEVDSAPLTQTGPVRAIVCVENLQSFHALYRFAALGWWVLHVPGYAPPAERRVLARVHALVPQAPVFAAFDPDPDGIHIAVLLARDSGVPLRAELMAPELLDALPARALSAADHELLHRLSGRAGRFEPLRAAIATRKSKAEQEGANPWLVERIDQLNAQLPR